jgi:hypothetical protein
MAHRKASKRSKARTMLRLADLEQSKNSSKVSWPLNIWPNIRTTLNVYGDVVTDEMARQFAGSRHDCLWSGGLPK